MLVASNLPRGGRSLRAGQLARRAFTLMEILVVVAIIVVLAGLGTVSLMNELERAKERTATVNAKTIKGAAQSFKVDNGSWPTNLHELVPRYLEKQETLRDPWGNEYQFQGHEDENNRTFYVWTMHNGKQLGDAPR